MTSKHSSKRVIVAHAHSRDGEVFRRLLTKDGYEAVLVNSADQALAALESVSCVALLVGCGAPALDAAQLTTQVRGSKRIAPTLRIVGVLDRNAMGEPERSLQAGMNEVLVVPFAPADVSAALRSYVVV